MQQDNCTEHVAASTIKSAASARPELERLRGNVAMQIWAGNRESVDDAYFIAGRIISQICRRLGFTTPAEVEAVLSTQPTETARVLAAVIQEGKDDEKIDSDCVAAA